MSTLRNWCAQARVMLFAIVIASHGFSLAFGSAGEAIATREGASVAVETQRCIETLHRTQERDAGMLARSGYCGFEPTPPRLEVFKYHVEDADRTEIYVEIAIHPTEYPYVVHDMGGLLFAASTNDPRQTIQPARDEERGDLHVLDWIESDSLAKATICAMVRPELPGFLVAWYRNDPDTEKTVTVLMFSDSVEGLPKQLIDRFLEKYPSTVDVDAMLPEDWVDRDLEKWAQILRDEPKSQGMLHFVLSNVRGYEREAADKSVHGTRADWGLKDLRKVPLGSEEYRAKLAALATKLEEWRAQRKADK